MHNVIIIHKGHVLATSGCKHSNSETNQVSALSSHRLFGEDTKDKLPSAEFLSAVGTLKFRGTSILFRLAQSCVTHLKRSVLSLHSRDSVTLGFL